MVVDKMLYDVTLPFVQGFGSSSETYSVSGSSEVKRSPNPRGHAQVRWWPCKRSGSVVECLTRDRRAAGSSLTGVTAL